MIRSMTGFGEAQGQEGNYTWRIEVYSLNSRFLDLTVHLPAGLESLEFPIREQVARRLHRGRVRVRLDLEYQREPAEQVNWSALEHFLSRLRSHAERVGVPVYLNAGSLGGIPGVLASATQTFPGKEKILRTLEEALDRLEAARIQEGKATEEALRASLQTLEALLEKVEARKTEEIEKRKGKIRALLEEFLQAHPNANLEQRLAVEILFWIQKLDISEELSRARAHLRAFVQALRADGPVGRKLEFLLQEMGREVNTLAQKSLDPEIVQMGVQMKEELEKMREQVRNVE